MCITLPPAPPFTPPPPAPPLPPAPPAPPAPPSSPGMPTIVWDMQNSLILAPGDNAVTLPQILAQNGRSVESNAASLILTFQNNGNAAGSVTVNVTANDGGLTITPAQQNIPIAANNYSSFTWVLSSLQFGTYQLTITTNQGGSVTFPIAFNPPSPPP